MGIKDLQNIIILLGLFLVTTSSTLSQNTEFKGYAVDLKLSSVTERWLREVEFPDPRREFSWEERKNRKNMEDISARTITKADDIIKRNLLPDNPETRSYFYLVVGISYGFEGDIEKSTEYLRKAEEIARNKSDCHKLLVLCHSYLLSNYMVMSKYDSAFVLAKIIIEHYQGVGEGVMKNNLAARTVNNFVLVAEKIGKDRGEIKQYLTQLSEQYSNEIGCAADAELYRFSKKENDYAKASQIKSRILTRYPKTWEFEYFYKDIMVE